MIRTRTRCDIGFNKDSVENEKPVSTLVQVLTFMPKPF